MKKKPTTANNPSAGQNAEQTKPSVRYSDVALKKFKEHVEEKLEEARKNVQQFKETDLSDMHGWEREQHAYNWGRATQTVKDLEAALVRIALKTYGVCVKSGYLIPAERLKVVPTATFSVEAAELEARHKPVLLAVQAPFAVTGEGEEALDIPSTEE